ncbi:MAG: histidine kinase N-terminal 7TM domain-containing protein [Antarcticimicrobium sp.]|uniref:sensor histidine kinase n=1 Tax=Antarcticimicrobium sp. TaxID=2824147 RepID=UPI002629F452|nr:histidine kinase N-terminal 7TM domain-containing protein [Antarcticimicrobium sp.]MDF1717708.1 histidine kinase N-terminal 7TM domain-containing protein [Antarcticimicrobium sp.]
MTCLTSLELSFAPAAVAVLWAVAALVLAWVVRNNRFPGKQAFILAFTAMLWWLVVVGFELASQELSCKIAWASAAWPAIALLPMAWSFFLFDYTMNTNAVRTPLRRLCYVGAPTLASGIALTNGWHHLLYGTGTHMVGNGPDAYAVFEHGPLFFVIAGGLYVFVTSGTGVLAYAFVKAEKNIRPFLAILIFITVAPLAGNVAYVVWGFTILGFDPTPFLFSGALIAFSWLLVNNRMMDTEALGRDLLFYATQDPVIVMKATGQLAGANAAARALFADTLPKLGETLDHMEKIGPILNFLRETGELSCAEPITFGDRIYDPRALPIASPIQARNSLLGWTVTLVDITERERSAEARRKALVRAEEANRAKSEFLAVISHELRTPLTSLKGGLDLALCGKVGEVSDPVRKLLRIAEKNSVRLSKLIDDILDLQKLDLNEIALHLQDVEPTEFLRETVQEQEAQATEASVRFSVTSDGIRRRIRADPFRLKQVVGNVLSNAVKFSPKDGLVECSVSEIDGTLRLSVRDSGIGIPENAEDKVFGRFNQVDGSSTRVSGGSGLGMNIAKILIERMGGAISYESCLGAGTTFHIDMPLEPLSETRSHTAEEVAR